jgi:Zn-dependent protease
MLQDLNNPWWYAIKAIVLLLALPAHEASHALMAYLLGDDTAKHQGRISLNPLHHLDLVGTIMILIPGNIIGWAKPTPFNPSRLRGNRSFGSALIYVAGPLSNLLQAALFSLSYWVLLLSGLKAELPFELLKMIILINLALFIFNLLPLPPLDGFGALTQVAAGEFKYTLAGLQRLGFPILFVVLIADQLSGYNFIGRFIGRTAWMLMGYLLPASAFYS